MTIGTQDITAGHVVALYRSERELAQVVGAYLTDALGAGAVAIAIATEPHRSAFEAALIGAGTDAAQARLDGTLVCLDAAETIDRFTSEGSIDRDRFRDVIGEILEEAASTGRPLRVYGEMVALLWEDGKVPAAIEVEELWNDLQREFDFSLLCAYRSDSVSGDAHDDAFRQVCRLHSSVLHPAEAEDPHDDGVAQEISAQFPGKLGAPGEARRLVMRALRRWGYTGSVLDDVQLVLSELTTNAVLHARSPFSLLVRSEGSRIRVAVSDRSAVRPIPRDRGRMTGSGRGLHLIADVASRWGVEVTPGGKTVWAELSA